MLDKNNITTEILDFISNCENLEILHLRYLQNIDYTSHLLNLLKNLNKFKSIKYLDLTKNFIEFVIQDVPGIQILQDEIRGEHMLFNYPYINEKDYENMLYIDV